MALIGTISIAMSTSTKGLTKGLGKARAELGQFTSSLTSLPSLLTGALAGAGAAGLFTKMVSGASDLNENMNKVQAIFGSASSSVIADSQKMADAFGMSKNEFLDSAGKLGGLFKGAGFGGDDVAALSTQFVKLSADASSFFNVPFDVALQKLRSGLSGEAEPLRDFGVFLTEDAVKAKAMAMGLATAGQELSNQAKVQARAAIITESLKDAQGDLAKTADGLANSSREFSGRIENLSASFGQTLAPIAGAALADVNTGLVALQTAWDQNKESIIAWGSSALESMGITAGGMGMVQRSIDFVADEWDALKLGFGLAQSYITDGIGKIVKGLSYLGKGLDWVIEKTTGAKTGMGDFLETWSEDLKGLSEKQFEDFQAQLAKPPSHEGIDAYFANAKDKVAGLRQEIGKSPIAAAAAGTGSGPGSTGKDIKFAGAAMAGSQEAASIINNTRARGADVQSKLANNSENQTKILEQIRELLAKNGGGTLASSAVSVLGAF